MGVDFAFSERVNKLNLESSLNRVLGIAADEDATIAVGAELEFQVEDKVAVSSFRPDGSALQLSSKSSVLGINFPDSFGQILRQVEPSIERLSVEKELCNPWVDSGRPQELSVPEGRDRRPIGELGRLSW